MISNPANNTKNFQLNFFRFCKKGDHVILTTDHGGWAILSNAEYLKLLKYEVDAPLYNSLLLNGIIVTEDNINQIIENYKKRYHYFYTWPSLHIVVPTTRCNHVCIYCHSNAQIPSRVDETMDQNTVDSILDFIFQSPSPVVLIEFQGGESLIAFDIVQYLVKKAHEKNKEKKKIISFAIVTNLSLLKDEMIEFLNEYQVKVTTSLDGPKYVHNQNRQFFGGGDTYDTVVENMTKLKKRGVNVGMLMVTTRHSLPYWKEIIDEYLKHGQQNIRLKYLDYLGVALHVWDKIGYTMEEYLDFWQKSVDYIFSLNKKGVVMVESYVELILRKLNTSVDPNFLDLRSPCGIVTGQLAYNYNGDIYSCDEGRSDKYYVLGNVKKDNYQQVLSSEKSKALISASINENYLCDACVYKPFCGLCPVLSRAVTNSLQTSVHKDNHCKQFKMVFGYVMDKIINEPKDIKRILIGIKLDKMLNSSLNSVINR